jgi:hypothetical protein
MLRRLLPSVTAALLVAGCGGAPAATPPRATRTTASSTTSSAPPTVAPTAALPVDLSPGYRHPCATLTAGQQGRVGFRPPMRETADESVGRCRWGTSYVLELHPHTDVLAEAYRNSGDPKWAVFEPREVHGVPAVVRAAAAGGGTCEVVVGVSRGQGVVLGADTKPAPGLCDRLVTAAGLVVETLRRWQGV